MELLEVIEYIKELDIHVITVLLGKLTMLMGSFRLMLKPVTSFYMTKINPYVHVRPTEKLLSHPLYKSASFLLDYLFSVKTWKEKKND